MAEYVQQMLEEMLPELEEMNNLGLFTTKETKIIKKNRENFEYRLRQLTKTKASFLNYVEYEKKLLELLKIKRKKITGDSKKREIEKSIADRIHQLYRLATIRFQDDVSLWQEHIDFSKALNEKAYVTRLYKKVLKLHSHNEDLWINSAQWESSADGNGNHELAREILLQAHRVNPESQRIFLEMLQMELQFAKQIIKRKAILGIKKSQEEEDLSTTESVKVDELKVAEIVYKKGLDIFPGWSSFHLKMLAVVSRFKEAKGLEADVVSDLKTLYPKDASVWNAIALQKLYKINKMSASGRCEAVTQCLQVYQEAVTQLATEKMLTLCLNSLLNLLEVTELSECHAMILNSLLHMFQSGVKAGLLTEHLYLELLSLLTSLSLHEEASSVTSTALSNHPASTPLWLAKLKLMADQGEDNQAILTEFRTSLRRVSASQSWPLWQFALDHLARHGCDKLEGLMEQACRSGAREVCCPAKIWSLNWTFTHGNIKKFRKAYSALKGMRPTNIGLYRLYVEKECEQQEPNLSLVRTAFEEALSEFGREEPDLWLNYIEMERRVAKDAAKAGLIQQRAVRGLEPHLKETFVRKQVLMGFGWES